MRRKRGFANRPAFPREWLEGSLFDAFRARAEWQPDRLAIQDGSMRLNYGELLDRSLRIAAGLDRGGYDRSLPVALWYEPGCDHVTALMGVLAWGGFFLPLDPKSPDDRCRKMLEDAGSELVLASGDELERATGLTEVHGSNLEALDSPTDGRVQGAVGELAFLLYTSGSTGHPKGVMQGHRNVLHNAMTHIESFELLPDDRVSLLYPSNVYGGNRDIFNALLSGASLHRYPLDRLGLGPLIVWMLQQRISVFCCVATLFRQFVGLLQAEQFPDLRLIKVGGEAVFRAEVERFQERMGKHCRLSCGLGATEFGAARQFFVDSSTALEDARIPCGFPVEGMEIEILSEDGEVLPLGGAGEIAVRSEYLSLGYWRNPELTGKVLNDGVGGTRRYRSGDLGMLRPDGQLIHLGRKDLQIKIHGNRVELLDVEAHLAEWDQIRGAAVMVDQGGPDPEMVAFVATEKSSVPLAEMRAFLSDRLPGYMIPTRLECLGDLPQLSNGKVDRVALGGMLDKGDRKPLASEEGDGGVEGELLAIWQRLIRRDDVGLDDEFLVSGGDSLAMMQLLLEVERKLGKRLALPDLLEAPTIRLLSKRLASAKASSGRGPIVLTEEGTLPVLRIIPLRVGGSKPPLILAAPGGGSALPYLGLAMNLDPDQPVYGLEIYIPLRPKVDLDIKEMARVFERGIRAIQSHGPYYLGGWSFGGFLIAEIASLIENSGDSVALLMIVDSDRTVVGRRMSVSSLWKMACLFFELMAHSKDYFYNQLHLMIAENMRTGWHRVPRWRRWLQTWFWKNGAGDAEISEVLAENPGMIELQHSWFEVTVTMPRFLKSIERFEMPALKADIDLLCPDGGQTGGSAELWGADTSGLLTIHHVEGGHIGIFDDEHAEGIARLVGDLLEARADQPKGASSAESVV